MDDSKKPQANSNNSLGRSILRRVLGFLKKIVKVSFFMTILAVIGFFVANALMPLPVTSFEDRTFAQLVVDADNKPLRAFADENGVWRYPVTKEQVSPLYIEALLNYEDRYFYKHPGVNPFALFRAAGQALWHGEVVSGGSTLTMQVARILEPHSKTFSGKLKQMFRALQLEWRFSKDEILDLYLNYAPFGGTIEGVEAASYTYLGKSSRDLTHSEAALLAVLPQAPSRNRPDRYPERAKIMRDKVLDRLKAQGVWESDTVDEIKIEQVWAEYNKRPTIAPILSRSLSQKFPQKRLIKTAIDSNLQIQLEELLKSNITQHAPGVSAAILIVDNKTNLVKAYVGSADFANEKRFGYVDMVQAVRSPGSTLKPFIYGMALDQGLIHSESLLFDVPQSFNGYKPKNYSDNFHGPVSVSQSLSRSLNMPAVQLLNKITPELFYSELTNAGVRLQMETGARPNLSLALGGGSLTLQQLVGLFTSLGNGGFASQVRLTPDDPVEQYPLLSKASAWLVNQLLSQVPLNDHVISRQITSGTRIAYKTGTSYGGRDTWVVGSSKALTIGVWVGSPDGSFMVESSGRITAVPILRQIVSLLPKSQLERPERPDNISYEMICWPLGSKASLTEPEHCHQKKQAFLIDLTAPPTFAEDNDRLWSVDKLSILLDKKTGARLTAECLAGRDFVKKDITVWPSILEPWLALPLRRSHLLPKYDPKCPNRVAYKTLLIEGIDNLSTLYPEPNKGVIESLQLKVQGATGQVYWFLNNQLLKDSSENDTKIEIKNVKIGSYKLMVIDQSANHTSIEFRVER